MKRLSLALALFLAACTSTKTGPPVAASAPAPAATSGPGAQLDQLIRSYTVEFLRRNPAVNTYLGGAGLDPSLKETDGRLRDHSAAALSEEDAWLAKTHNELERIDPAKLTPNQSIDREVALAQVYFLLHQHQVRTYQRRALDTYTEEPFRSVDFQLQGMTDIGSGHYGTEEEWRLVASRLSDFPRYFKAAEEQLQAGVQSMTPPDARMLFRHGIQATDADAAYFEKTLPALASERVSGPHRDAIVQLIAERSAVASNAYRDMHDWIARTFFDDPTKEAGVKSAFAGDHFASGTPEYDWALRNNLRVTKSAAQLFDESWPIVMTTQKEMTSLAKQIATTHGWSVPADDNAAVRAVFDQLSKDYPKSDAEMIAWYRDAAFRLVGYGRKTGLFDVPSDYKLEVIETPPPLQASIEGAAYYPAPPFKDNGVGRYYVTPTHNDPAALQANNRSALADLSAHEGFPGHDWYYKLQTKFRGSISPVRWLTPGAIEDSSSMWEDSMAGEGWALYSEALMAEPQAGKPDGFYSPEERLYQLQGKLLRDLRVRIDTGIHTGRMKYGEAVDLYSQVVDFLPGSCSDAAAIANDAKRASCTAAESAIFRYSKWPTQAITYRLGKDEILALRAEAAAKLGPRFSAKNFHMAFIRQGSIPAGYFRQELLDQLK